MSSRIYLSVFLVLPKFGNMRSRVFHTKKEVHSQAINVTASPSTINNAVILKTSYASSP